MSIFSNSTINTTTIQSATIPVLNQTVNAQSWIASEYNFWFNSTFLWMPNWKWLTFIAIIFGGLLLKTLLEYLVLSMQKSPQFRDKVHGFVLHFLETKISKPIAWILTSVFWRESIENLALPTILNKYLLFLLQMNLSIFVIMLAYRGVDAFGKVLEDITAKTENTLDDQLAPLATKSLKVFVIVFGGLIILQNFGVNVMSLLAGLGLGGLALALAAQDTAANVFGSITIILDRPFQVGDWVKVGDTEGFIEEIGFRSTRIRTMYKSVVSIPNSIMAKEKIDNMGLRPMHRIRHNLGFTYDASEDQLRAFMDRTRYLLSQHPDIAADTVIVRFNALAESSLNILVNFFVKVTDVGRELEIQQEILFELMGIAAELKLEFAFPTQTHHIRTN